MDAALLRPVSKEARLLDVFTQALHAVAHHQLFGETVEGLDQTIRVWSERLPDQEDPRLLASLVTVEQEIAEDGEVLAEVSAQVGLLYELPSGLDAFSPEQLDLFAEVNGMFNAWPYLREILESTTTRLGLRVRSLPTWHAPATLPARGEPLVLRQRFDGR